MKTKLFSLLIVLALCLVSCGKNSVAKEEQSGKTDESYKIVTPTQEELDEIEERLSPILIYYWDDYDCKLNNIYDTLFTYNTLNAVEPSYSEEVSKYVEKPTELLDNHIPVWYTVIHENDPLGHYGEISAEAFDENGNYSEELTVDLKDNDLVGYKKYSASYIDWLVVGVWNGTPDHETFFKFEDGSKCYYHDDFYYIPEKLSSLGDRGSFFIEKCYTTPLEDKKYEIKYTVLDDLDEPWYNATAVIAMKESQDGFRFWSIYSIDTEWIETDFSSVG